MEVGIREAKNSLSKLVDAARSGKPVYLTNRGQRVAQILPAPKRPAPNRGFGCLKGKINLYPGWDSREEDDRIAKLFLDSIDLEPID